MLLCVMGNSGVGKDTVIKTVIKLCKKDNIEVKKLVNVTDRPKRANEKNSTDYSPYIFVSKASFIDLVNSYSMVECRSYQVDEGVWWDYGTTKLDFEVAINSKDIYITTCTPTQFTSYYDYTKLNYPNLLSRLYPIFIDAPSEKERLLRSINRLDKNDIRGLKEVCRRFYKDKEYINPLLVPSMFRVVNEDVQDTASYVVDLIDTFLDYNEDDSWNTLCQDKETFGVLLDGGKVTWKVQ